MMPGGVRTPETTDLRGAAEERYLNYALSVITARALPDVRDGLKPVQRRILYAMYHNLRLTAGTRPRKSAAVVGEVLGKYHPHGDQAAYEAMVRMAQPFALRYPLVHGEGNFGSVDGDGAAAMRYTEARLTAVAGEMLADLGKETVVFRPNYDATIDEPGVLPAAVPQLLMNGSTGIAVGMATNIPPHNLREIVAALVAMIETPAIEVRGLLKHIKGPDFPTGGQILNSKAEIRSIYETGQGAIRLRGTYTVERLPRGRRQIVLTSVPYMVNKAELVEHIGAEVMARKLPLVLDVRDESTDDVRVVLELKPEAEPEPVMAYVYKHTALQTNFNVNLTCLLPTESGVGQPARVDLRDLCRHFLDFRMDVVTHRLEFERRKLEDRLHILAALVLIYDDLDTAIRIIRRAKSRQDAADGLMKRFRLDQRQADAILEIRLYQLAQLEIAKIREEQAEKQKRLKEIVRLLKSPKARWGLIRDELAGIAKTYGDARRTAVGGGEELEYDPEAYIVHEETVVILSRDGWIRRVREVKDRSSVRLREGDAVRDLLVGSTRDRLALFASQGSMYVIRVADVPATTGYGEPVQSLLRLKDGEHVTMAYLLGDTEDAQVELPGLGATVDAGLLVATAKGYGFRMSPDLGETTRSGRKYARVAAGDAVVSVTPVAGTETVLATAKGRMLRFPLADVSELSGPGRGVILLRTNDDDSVVGALAVDPDGAFTVVTPEGTERRVRVADVPRGRRAGKGQRVVKRGGVAAIAPREG